MGCDDELGYIEPGKLADLVPVDGKPDQDIRDIRKIDTIIIDGVVHTSDKLYRAVGVE